METDLKFAAHGTTRVSIVAIPKYFGYRLVYLSWKGEFSWAIRDFINRAILRSGDSLLRFSDIKALVTYSEKPVYRSVGRAAEWAAELVASSEREFGSKYDGHTAPSSEVGKWKLM